MAPDVRFQASLSVADRVLELARPLRWRTVLGYAAHDGEIDPAPILDRLRRLDVGVALPRVAGSAMTFHRIEPDTPLEPGVFGIATPPAGAPVIDPATVDAVLVPLVGFDDQGNRLGMGGGYYDRVLARAARPLRLGLALDCQRLERLRSHRGDERLDVILTPTMTLITPARVGADAPILARSRP